MNFYLNANDMMDLSHSLLMAPVKLVDGCAGVLFRRVTYNEWVSMWYPKVNNSYIMATHCLLSFTHLFSHIKNIDHLTLIISLAEHLNPFVPCEACCCGVHFSVNVWWGHVWWRKSLCCTGEYSLHISHILLLYSGTYTVLLQCWTYHSVYCIWYLV